MFMGKDDVMIRNLFVLSTGLLLLATAVQGQQQTLKCPIPSERIWPCPDNPSSAQCSFHTACEWSSPNCYMKDNGIIGYNVVSAPVDTGRGFQVQLKRISPDLTIFDGDIENLTFEVINHEDYHVEIKIYDSDNARYEVPVPLNLPLTAGSNPMYDVQVSAVGTPFAFTVTRTSNGNTLFNSVGALSFENQFIQISSSLMSSYVYGFGESIHNSFRRQFSPRDPYAIFSRDQVTENDPHNEYGHHPYYMVMEDDQGNSHSNLIFNSNAMEYDTFFLDDGTTPALTLRAIGGILDMHFFLGPTPEDVNVQYINMIGLPVFPKYQTFGFQLCRWGYTSTDEVRAVRQRTKDNGIPQDVQVLDIDYMLRYRDFTVDPVNWGDLAALVQELHDDGLEVTLILDPGIVTDWANYPTGQRGLDADAYIKWSEPEYIPSDQPADCADYVVGYVWPDFKTVLPDFFKPETQDWWATELQLFHDVINYDNIWIDMNEPANFGTDMPRPWNYPPGEPDWSLKCPYNNLDSPPYPTRTTCSGYSESGRISDHSLCMSAMQTDGVNNYLHYDVHSLYGWSQAEPTYRGLEAVFPGKRPYILTRSTFPGIGKYTVHWLGDNKSEWPQIKLSIVGMMEFNMFGIPYIGPDICGFQVDTTEQLCSRWMEVGAFYPFSRNHNAIDRIDQDPGVWPNTVAVYAREALLLRYKYLPYLYSLFYKANQFGSTVIRPLLNLFPDDITARDVDDQFLWADGLMIAPVITEDTYSRDVYFPQGSWYDLRTGALAAVGPVQNVVSVPIEYIPVYIRGGVIIPFQNPEVTTTLSRLNPFGLTIAIENDAATGFIFWDDGSVANDIANSYLADVTYSGGELQLTVTSPSAYVTGLNIETLQFYGATTAPTNVAVNGVTSTTWTYNDVDSVLDVSLSVPLSDDLTVTII